MSTFLATSLCQFALARRCYGNVTKQMLSEFEEIVGSHALKTSYSYREQHGHDESYHRCQPPAAVVFPESTEQVSKLVKICSANKTPIIPFGTGTGMEGGVSAIEPESVSIDLSLMKKIDDPNIDDFDVTVEAGVTRLELNRVLRTTGLFFPIDPGADASLCGMCATAASGTMAVKYGTMLHNVLNLQVVLPSGDVIDTAGPKMRARKSSAGYNLTQLFMGSEGTLGVITKATLRLHPLPNHIAFAVAEFPSTEAAVNSVVDVMKMDIPVARMEFIDDVAVKASNKYSKIDQKECPMLMFEVHTGSANFSNEHTDVINEVCEANGATNIVTGTDFEERSKLWKARHDALYAAMSLRPDSKCYVTDVCVPLSELSGVIEFAKEGLRQNNLLGTIIGHVGDGNFHVLIPIVDFENEVPVVAAYAESLGLKALAVGGTCTGEHGIGTGKRKLLSKEVGDSALGVMRALKRAIDVDNVMNPGKVIDF